MKSRNICHVLVYKRYITFVILSSNVEMREELNANLFKRDKKVVPILWNILVKLYHHRHCTGVSCAFESSGLVFELRAEEDS